MLVLLIPIQMDKRNKSEHDRKYYERHREKVRTRMKDKRATVGTKEREMVEINLYWSKRRGTNRKKKIKDDTII